jgi:hypothetical protein
MTELGKSEHPHSSQNRAWVGHPDRRRIAIEIMCQNNAMIKNAKNLPTQIESEIGAVISSLVQEGWVFLSFRHTPMSFGGNWCVYLRRADVSISFCRDRSQYMVDGPIEEIKAAGLFKAFNDLEEFKQAVIKWAATL